MKVAGTLPPKPQPAVSSDKPANWDQMTAKQKKNFKKKLTRKKKKLERSQVMSQSSVASAFSHEEEIDDDEDAPNLDINIDDVALEGAKAREKTSDEDLRAAASRKDSESNAEAGVPEPGKTRRGPKIGDDV